MRDGRHVVHAKCSEDFAPMRPGVSGYGHLVLRPILPQVLGIRPTDRRRFRANASCGSPLKALTCLTGASGRLRKLPAVWSRGRTRNHGDRNTRTVNFRCGAPCGKFVPAATRRAATRKRCPSRGAQGPPGQEIAHGYGWWIAVFTAAGRCAPSRRAPGCPAPPSNAVVEFLVGEMTDVLYPAVTSDDDVRRRDPEMERRRPSCRRRTRWAW